MEELVIPKTTFLDFDKEKVQVLTIDQLQKTQRENDYAGRPIAGIYHFALVNRIVEMAKDAGFDVDIYDLFAAQNKEKKTPGVSLLPELEQKYGERACEAHILRRVFANIRLTNFDDDTYTTNLAVAFHQKGIQVGFGNMVKICHNQCMLGASNYASTYGEKGGGRGNGMDIPELLNVIAGWLGGAERKVIEEREKIERMKQIVIPAQQMLTIIGELTAIRVKCDSLYKEIRDNRTYPLNQSQITQLTEDMLLRYHRNNEVTAWDLYNGATELYKANTMDIPSLLPQNKAMCQYMDNLFFS